MFDVTDTIKVSNVRVVDAFRTALAALDEALPEMLTLAGVLDARRKERYDEVMKQLQEQDAKDAKELEAWCEYEKAMLEYNELLHNRTWRSPVPGPMPVKPSFPKPYRDWGRPRMPAPSETRNNVTTVKTLRAELKKHLDVASLAITPCRVSYKQAAFIASCENGDYVESLKSCDNWLLYHGSK